MRTLVRWNPYRDIVGWHRDTDDLFDRFFSSFWSGGEAEALPAGWLPSLETFSKDGREVVRLDLPGVDPKKIEISVENDTLIIRGERRSSDEVNDKNYHYRETSYGRFERKLALPKGVDGEKVNANYKNGVLEISVPLPEKLAGKAIPVQIDDSHSRNLSA